MYYLYNREQSRTHIDKGYMGVTSVLANDCVLEVYSFALLWLEEQRLNLLQHAEISETSL